ncbi:MAG: UvrD-helicase domain-containing protein [Pseudomonadota bacterium]|nr:UvrD-helicase domain-containing protein [Pseudomonadota bacterium]
MNTNIRFISAGAGSGKTYSLTRELEELLSKGQVTPAGVIATTFTKLAAGELQERVRSALIEAGQQTVANQMEQALIGTVNSVCGELLRRFAFEAGLPPDQQVLDESQGDVLFYQAMELVLDSDRPLIRQMNAACHRLQIIDHRKKHQLWRQEVKKIADAARVNNQTTDDIRHLGASGADQLLAHFPGTTRRDLGADLLGAVNHALSGIDTDHDGTKGTREYLSFLKGVQTALINRRLTWPEWISLTKKMPGTKSKDFAQPIADIAADYARHPELHRDLRFFSEQAFRIAADSLDTYQDLKTRKGLIDFVDQEQRLYRLLDDTAVAGTLREELQLLMVDEFQDTSPIQLALFLKLSRLSDQVIWVGDVKQSIYGFRGSDPTLMRAVVERVVKDGNPLEVLKKSWRSRPELVAYANHLFVPAFADSLAAEQVRLEPAREPISIEPAVETWRLTGKNKTMRAQALASGLQDLMVSGREVVDKIAEQPRNIEYGDIAILCRTHDNLGEIAAALAEARLPISYQRPGLLNTPEGCLGLACLRRLVDPLDTLASAEIISLSTCVDPEDWITHRMRYLDDREARSHAWQEEDPRSPVAALREQRDRLPYLTPVEALRVALEAGKVRETTYRWGPTEQRSQHRLNNLSALLRHAGEYLNQCTVRSEPATTAGLVLWLQALREAEEDTQASGGGENAIQLVTHHGAKGLEWPIVAAMDLDAKLKPRLWGLNVEASPDPVSLDDPLARRTLRYWPKFFGRQSANIPLLDQIEASAIGQAAMEQEIQESKRLLYVSLTRPRDCLILTMDNIKKSGPWMDVLGADWMLPTGDLLCLPDGTKIPSAAIEPGPKDGEAEIPVYRPAWLETPESAAGKLPLNCSPSAFPPLEQARIGKIIDLGERLETTHDYDPAVLGSALHAIIATTLMGQGATERVLTDYGMRDVISIAAANECTRRLLHVLQDRFSPTACYAEHPVSYTTDRGQIVSGWIDLLLETKIGFVVIDHKASPRAKPDWNDIALGYSGQLQAYADGVVLSTEKPVHSCWIHFAVTGGLVQLSL